MNAPFDPLRRTVSIGIGDILITREPETLTTVLGSCVSVCLHDAGRRIGGMNHFLLPDGSAGNGIAPFRFGADSIPELIRRMTAAGSRKSDLTARIFGGAHVLLGVTAFQSIPERNIEVARRILKEQGIRVTAEDVGGDRGRRVWFEADSGGVRVRCVSPRDQL